MDSVKQFAIEAGRFYLNIFLIGLAAWQLYDRLNDLYYAKRKKAFYAPRPIRRLQSFDEA